MKENTCFQKKITTEIMDWIENNLEHRISLEDISKVSGYSNWHFQRLFKKHTGKNLGDYILERKLKKSYNLLSTTKLSVFAVSCAVGFKTQQSFNRSFKKCYGISPGKIKMKHNDKNNITS